MKIRSSVWLLKEDNDLHRQTNRHNFFVGFGLYEAQNRKIPNITSIRVMHRQNSYFIYLYKYNVGLL